MSRKWIFSIHSQTGDVSHVAGALVLDKETNALVLFDAPIAYPSPLLDFYKQAAHPEISF